MGDRGNIVVRQAPKTNRDDVWFYGHWSGYQLEETVRTALARNARWDDPSYLARIIFNDFQGDNRGETGFGISTTIGDNSYPIIVVDQPGKMVRTVNEDDLIDGRLPDDISGFPGVEFKTFAVSANAPT